MGDWFPGPGWLFCPADRPDRYVKALERADVVVLDLEDAVVPSGKDSARTAVRVLFDSGQLDVERTVLRINDADSEHHRADLALVADLGVARVMLAKAERPDDVAAVEAQVVVLVETPRGVERAGALAEPANVLAVMWGADDLVAGLGGTSSRRPDGTYRDVARYARSRALVAAKACGRLALDAVFMDIADTVGLRAQCEDGAAVGFDTTVAIHPSQVPVVRSAYEPSAEQVAWARRLLEAAGPDRGVTTYEGRMVDGPIYAQAERVVRLAARAVAAGQRR